MFILPAGRHPMLLQYADMYAKTGHSNTKYNMKYNYFGFGSLRDKYSRFSKVNHDLTTQLSIIITGLLTQTFVCMECLGIFQRWWTKANLSIQNLLDGTHCDI